MYQNLKTQSGAQGDSKLGSFLKKYNHYKRFLWAVSKTHKVWDGARAGILEGETSSFHTSQREPFCLCNATAIERSTLYMWRFIHVHKDTNPIKAILHVSIKVLGDDQKHPNLMFPNCMCMFQHASLSESFSFLKSLSNTKRSRASSPTHQRLFEGVPVTDQRLIPLLAHNLANRKVEKEEDLLLPWILPGFCTFSRDIRKSSWPLCTPGSSHCAPL